MLLKVHSELETEHQPAVIAVGKKYVFEVNTRMEPLQGTVEQGRTDTEDGPGRLPDTVGGAVPHARLDCGADGEFPGLLAEQKGKIGGSHRHAPHSGVSVQRALGHDTAKVDARLQIVVQESVPETHRLLAVSLSPAAEYRISKIDIDREIAPRPLFLWHRRFFLISQSRKREQRQYKKHSGYTKYRAEFVKRYRST